MAQIPNRFRVGGEKRYNDFVRAVLAVLNGAIDNDNIADGWNLVTDAQLAALTAGSMWLTDGSSNLLRRGMPVYFSGVNTITLADTDDVAKKARAFCVYTNKSTALIQSSGLIPYVPIESGITIAQADDIYLSSTPGKTTNVPPDTGLEQYLGVAVNNGTAAGGTFTLSADIDSKGIQPF